MIVDGRSIASEIIAGLKVRRATIDRPVRLGIIVGTLDPVIESFVRLKTKAAADLDIEMVRVDIADPTISTVMDAVRSFKYDPSISGMIVQLPMPQVVDINAVLSEVNMEKDVDGINPFTRESERIARAPVARAVHEILVRERVEISNARVAVVGAGRLVGVPTAALLQELGAEVTTLTLNEGSLKDLKDADIIVSGAGHAHLIKPEHIQEGVVLIDAGASELGGFIQGDADPACAAIASVFTPVPGGVGPIAVSMIFKNLLDLVEARYTQS